MAFLWIFFINKKQFSQKPLAALSYWSELYHMPTSKPATSKGDGKPMLGLEQSRSVPMESTTLPDHMPHGGCILFKLRACCVVSQDCHNQLPQTAWLKQQQLIFHSSGGRNPRFWLGTLFFGLQTAAFSLYPRVVFPSVLWRERGER